MKLKRKILFCIKSLRGGGAEKVLIDILEHFDYSKYEVDLCLYFKTGVHLDNVPKNVNVFSVMPSNNLLMRIYNKVFFEFPQNKLLPRYFSKWFINKRIRKKYDVEIAFMQNIPSLIIGLHKSKAKKILWVHTDLNKVQNVSGINKKEQIKLYSIYSHIIFVSNDAKNGFNELFKNPKLNLQVIFNLIPKKKIIELSKHKKLNYNKPTFCTVGRLEEQKRVDRLIKAAALLREKGIKDFEVLIIGNGGLQNDLEKLTAKLGLEEQIKFLGFQKNPFPFVKNSDYYIQTSSVEGYPLSVCEALSLSKPVVATNTSGTNEVLGYGEYGLLTGHSPEEICEGMYQLLTQPGMKEKYELKAKEGAKNFNEELVMNQIYSILD